MVRTQEIPIGGFQKYKFWYLHTVPTVDIYILQNVQKNFLQRPRAADCTQI